MVLEVIHFILTKDKRLSRGVPTIAIKHDMTKAYDRISWEFIDFTLRAFHFSYAFWKLIMKCITSVSIAIRYNGCTTSSFKLSQRLRQGDPLSPLIFNLDMTHLAKLISSVAQEGFCMDVCFHSNDVHISRMSFVDDVVIFGKASLSNVRHMLHLFLMSDIFVLILISFVNDWDRGLTL